MNKNSKIYVSGHRGLVGSAIVRTLMRTGFTNIITRTRQQVDLTSQDSVERLFAEEQPEYVFLAAAKVGGIVANNTYPGEFILDNLLIQTNVIRAAHNHHVTKLMFLGSSCIYPKYASQPISEEELLTGPLEPTNEAYAIAKIAGLKLCQFMNHQFGTNFLAAMPTNLYGPNDNFDLEKSHVLPALLRKFHEAKVRGQNQVTIWGTGSPRREFLHVDDLANALLFLMENFDARDINGFVNIGTGEDIPIIDLAKKIADVVGFEGEIVLDPTKPDGTPRKLLNVNRMSSLGWNYKISLEEGIKNTYNWALRERVL